MLVTQRLLIYNWQFLALFRYWFSLPLPCRSFHRDCRLRVQLDIYLLSITGLLHVSTSQFVGSNRYRGPSSTQPSVLDALRSTRLSDESVLVFPRRPPAVFPIRIHPIIYLCPTLCSTTGIAPWTDLVLTLRCWPASISDHGLQQRLNADNIQIHGSCSPAKTS